ncbi:TetR family transcriptional regulator [Propionibacteriaceae bacterium G1746]|uniref:TetR family transcriptional regulator n=1 Tax=Aestuariimicrobium sp. G57 TaxID=3418485 RepID=UPI003C183C6A
MTSTTNGDTTPSRRDRNKAATRQALTRAAVDLSYEVGFDAVTADAVAERAGVSRRTFFNYFPSLEECITDPIQQVLDDALAIVDAAPVEAPIMPLATTAFSEVFSPATTPHLVRVMLLVREHPRLARSHLAQWRLIAGPVSDAVMRRTPDADPLWAMTLASSVLGVAEAAIENWLTSLPVADITPDDAALAAASESLRETVARSFGYLADGFATPPPTP